MKKYATLSELVSGVRFAIALARSSDAPQLRTFFGELDKAESAGSPQELIHFVTAAIAESTCEYEIDKLLVLIEKSARNHPLMKNHFEVLTDEKIAAVITSFDEDSIKAACRICDVLVDAEHMKDSINELAKLSIPQLLSFLPDSTPEETQDLDRLQLFEFAIPQFVWQRHIQKIQDFLGTTLKESQRDDLMLAIGIDIHDEDYETEIEDGTVYASLVADGLDSLKVSTADFVDWVYNGWKPKNVNLDVYEALEYVYTKLTPEQIKRLRDDLNDSDC